MRCGCSLVTVALVFTLAKPAYCQLPDGTIPQNSPGGSASTQPYYSPFTDPNSKLNLPFRSSVPVQNSNGKSVSGTFTWNRGYVRSQSAGLVTNGQFNQSNSTIQNIQNANGQFQFTPQMMVQVSMLFDFDGDKQLSIGELSNMAILFYGQNLNTLASARTGSNLAAAQSALRGRGLQQMQMLVQLFILQSLVFDIDQSLSLNQAELLLMYTQLLSGGNRVNPGINPQYGISPISSLQRRVPSGTQILSGRYPTGIIMSGRSGRSGSGTRSTHGTALGHSMPPRHGNNQVPQQWFGLNGSQSRRNFGGQPALPRHNASLSRSNVPNNFDTSLRSPGTGNNPRFGSQPSGN